MKIVSFLVAALFSVSGAQALALETDVQVPANARVVAEIDCSNAPGPQITLAGLLAVSGLKATLTFSNNRRLDAPHQRAETTDVELVILDPGEEISFNKQPPLGGVGGNPHIFLQFADHEGNALGDRLYLGRCKQGAR